MSDEMTGIEAIFDAAREAHQPRPIEVQRGTHEAAKLLVVPDGMKVVDTKPMLDALRSRPERRKGTATLHTLDAFVAHVKREADEGSAVFADILSSPPRLVAVYDYNEVDHGPRFGEHRAAYAFPLSEEWQAWTAAASHDFGQAEFARFLEDRLCDVDDPGAAGERAKRMGAVTGRSIATAANLLALAQGLEVNVKRAVKNAGRLSSGEMQIAFAEEHTDAKGEVLKVPGAFVIAIPVFRDGTIYQIPVRLNYRVRDVSVVWAVSIHDPRRYVDDAVKEALVRVENETALPVFRGTPEVSGK